MVSNRFAGEVQRQEKQLTVGSAAALSSRGVVRRHWLVDSSGTDELLNENYSSISCYYTVASPPMVLSSITLVMSDNAILTAPAGDDYATLCGGTTLTNGIKLYITDGVDNILDISGTYPIKKFADLAVLCGGNINCVSEDAAADSHRIEATISMDDIFGQMPVLQVGHKVIALLNDDFSTLDFFKIGIVGYSL
jgi:hypothetical protein